MNYYNHHIGDYAKDTAHLSMMEDGAYRRLIDICYASEKPLPLESRAVYRLARAQSKAERDAVDVVLREFFDRRDDGWHQKRCDEEIAKAMEEVEESQGRRENERERQRRYRQRRKELFEALREYGIVPKWDTAVEQLETLLSHHQSRNGHAPVTRDDTRDITQTETDLQRLTNIHNPLPNEPSLEPPEPPISEKSRKKRDRASETTVPEKFEVTDDMAQWAVDRGLPAESIEPETLEFLNWHKAKKSLYSDWIAAWRTWILKAVKFRKGRAA